MLYLDTSSLVKLYVAEAGSDRVRQLVRDANVVATSQETRFSSFDQRLNQAAGKLTRTLERIHKA
jgi:predicted nucleic acid-binding protein